MPASGSNNNSNNNMYSSPTFNTLRDSYDADNYKFGMPSGSGFKEMLSPPSPVIFDHDQVFTMAAGADGDSANYRTTTGLRSNNDDNSKLSIRRELTFQQVSVAR